MNLRPLLTRLASWQDRIRQPALSVLLAQVLLLFVVTPLSSAKVITYTWVSSAQILLLLVSFCALPRHSWVRWLILWSLLPVAWLSYASTDPHLGLAIRMLTTLGITVAVGQAVLQAPRITSHELLGAVVVYLNLALLFMGAFIFINTVFPGAFTSADKEVIKPGELLYFSLTTITSTGYGDLLPVHPLARSIANLEAIFGQLFLAILLGRLVSQHVSARYE